MSLPKVICLSGPTASGKTDLAIALGETFPCSIISVDSAMVYRGMDIGTAKPDAATLARAPHQLVDIRDPWETYSAGDFCADAVREINAAVAAGKTPLLAGGTMMYFHALQNGLAELPEADAEVRAGIDERARAEGWPALHAELQKLDSVAAEKINPTDAQRIQRALEVCYLSGEPISELQKNTRPALEAEFINIGLFPEDRTLLHERIARRFDVMLADGFQDEVRGLLELPQMTPEAVSLRSVGYRQMTDYLTGACDLDEAREKAIVATRRLAKRQMTWMRSMAGLRRLDCLSADLPAQASQILAAAGLSVESV